MLIMLLQVSGGAEGHRREGKHGADAHEPEDQREHAPTRSGGSNGNGGATTTAAAMATAEQQQWRRQRGSTSVGNQEASAREGRRSRTRGGVRMRMPTGGAVHRNQEAGESGERECGGERTSTRRARGVRMSAGRY